MALHEALNMISLFSICSGLRANFDKTQVNWIGAIIDSPKPKNSKDLDIKDHSSESKAFSKSESMSRPGGAT
jgi:hypothetical protein